TLNPRPDVHEGVTELADLFGQLLDRLLDLRRVVPVAGLDGDQRTNLIGTEIRKLAGGIQRAETIAVAFLDREGDDEGTPVWHQLGHGRNDPEVGIAFGQIKLTQQ